MGAVSRKQENKQTNPMRDHASNIPAVFTTRSLTSLAWPAKKKHTLLDSKHACMSRAARKKQNGEARARDRRSFATDSSNNERSLILVPWYVQARSEYPSGPCSRTTSVRGRSNRPVSFLWERRNQERCVLIVSARWLAITYYNSTSTPAHTPAVNFSFIEKETKVSFIYAAGA